MVITSGTQTEVKINGIDVSSQLKGWKLVETFGDEIRDANVEVFRGVSSLITLENGQSITIKRGITSPTTQFVFDGTIDAFDKVGPYIKVRAKDRMQQLVDRSVRKSFDGVAFPATESKGSDIAKTLIEQFGGLTASVVDTGAGVILRKFICNGTDVFSRLQKLAEIYDFQIFFDADDQKVHFEPKGFTTGVTLTVGADIPKIPKWQFDATNLVNRVIVRGAVQEVRDEQFFDGDGTANQVFTLAKIPITVQLFEIVASVEVEKVPGVEGSTTPPFDYTVDKENRKITTTDTFTPAAGTDNVKVVFSSAIPVPVQVQDAASQVQHGLKQQEKFFNDVQTVDDAEQRGSAFIARFKDPFVKVTCPVISNIDIDPGQLIRIDDDVNDEDQQVVVNRVIKQWPHQSDIIEAGDKEWRLADWGTFTLERIRRLEELTQQSSDLLVQINSFDREIKVFRRYLIANIRNIIATGEGFILGHPDEGILTTNKLGGETTIFSNSGILVNERVIWPDRTYEEDFIDEDFKDVGGSGNWDTTATQLVL